MENLDWMQDAFEEETAQEAVTEAAEKTAEAENSGAAEASKAFTQTDIDRIVQRTIRSERQRAERLIEEAREKANLDAEEKSRAEKEQLEKEILAREEEIRRRELRAGALELLADRGLPRELADTLDFSGAERMQASLEGVEKAFRSAVQRSVEERLRGGDLPGRGAPAAADLSRLSDEEYYKKVLKKTKE